MWGEHGASSGWLRQGRGRGPRGSEDFYIYGQHLAADMKRIYTAPNADAAWAAFEEFEEKWAKPYPAIATLLEANDDI